MFLKKHLSIFGKKFFVLTAHPDDESYFAAGTLHENAKFGGRNIIICASRGEKGLQDKTIRRKNLLKVARLLSNTKVIQLNLPDGRVKYFANKLYRKCLSIAEKEKPEIILSFGPDGITGHWDHIAASKVAKKIAKKFSMPFLAFSLWPKVSKIDLDAIKSRRIAKTYTNRLFYKEPNIKIKINAKIKKQALRLYKTVPKKLGILEKKLLNIEYFTYEQPKYH